MLSIKTGLAIHIDYRFDVLNQDGTVSATYGFVNNELLNSGLLNYAKPQVFTKAEFGLSNTVTTPDMTGVLIPIKTIRLNDQLTTNTLVRNPQTNQVVLHSVYSVNVTGFQITQNKALVLNEFGVDGLSRVLLKDPYQSLNGIILQRGQSIQVTIDFTYTYYTNNLTTTLGADVFGEEIDYTCETFVLPQTYISGINHNRGYATDKPMDIFPITDDIRDVITDNIQIPKEDAYQQKGSKVDNDEQRIDMLVVGYRPTETIIFGFVLKDYLRKVGVLVRFNHGVKIERDKRYEVGGYIKWGRVVENIDDGYITLDGGVSGESIGIQSGIPAYNITRPKLQVDVAHEIKSLNGLSFTIGTTPVTIPSNATLADVTSILTQFGLKATLLSNRALGNKSSTLDYIRPESMAHQALVTSIKASNLLNGKTNYLFPVVVAGGDYIDTTINQNQWRWDCYFPYMGQSQLFVGYIYGGFNKGLSDIQQIATYVDQGITTESYKENGGNVTLGNASYLASQLLTNKLTTTEGAAISKVFTIEGNVDPSITTTGFTTTYVSDFDTSTYGDWITGTSVIRLNYRYLDLTTTAIPDTAKNVTEFRIVFDSSLHDPTQSDLWINQQKVGPLSSINLTTFNQQYGLRVTKTVTGNRTVYNFTRPYTTENSDYIDVFIVGNEKATFATNEVGYLKIISGSQGYRVYNKTGSEITSSLYLEDNPFLLMGVRLYQPLPDYMFKYRTLTAAQAALYFGSSVSAVLNNNLFTIGFSNNTYSVKYQNTIDWKDPNLNTNSIYPAIGVDLTKIDSFIAADQVLFRDPDGHDWTKQELDNVRVTHANQVFDDTLYFAVRSKIVEGSTKINRVITSSFYEQSITLDLDIEAVIRYTLESAVINPNPIVLMVGDTQAATYTYTPVNAVITSANWATLDPLIATVDTSGVVKGVSKGTTTLRLTLNNSIIATAVVNVIDANVVISCDGAPNITTCLTLTGTSFGLEINDLAINSSMSADAVYAYFRDNDSYRIVNCQDLTKPSDTAVMETAFLSLDGNYDLYISGTLVGKDMDGQEVLDELKADPRLRVIEKP